VFIPVSWRLVRQHQIVRPHAELVGSIAASNERGSTSEASDAEMDCVDALISQRGGAFRSPSTSAGLRDSRQLDAEQANLRMVRNTRTWAHFLTHCDTLVQYSCRFSIDDKLGHYEALSLLGVGGMA